MEKNVYGISVWAWVALLICVFGCGDKAEKEKKKPKIYDYNLCTDEVMKWDTAGYQLCCEANNACWDQVDSLGKRLSFPVLKEYGFPKMCLDFVKRKDSTAYYACCKKYNACWVASYDKDNKRTNKQLEYEIIQKDSSYYDYNVIKINFEKSIERELKKIDSLKYKTEN